MKTARARSRATWTLLAVLVATTACQRGGGDALKVTSGTLGRAAPSPGQGVDATGDANLSAPPAPRNAAKHSSTTRRTASAHAPVQAAATRALTLTDTNLTRVRVKFDTQADWAGLNLDGTEIVTYKVVETTGKTRITSLGPTIGVADAGTAVIDFVLRIAPGAPTGMTMCKNYLGPTTVTITRLTDTPAVVATLANSGSDAHPPKGECENRMHQDVSRAGLIGPVRWPARQDPRPLVLAHYFPWYDDSNAHQDFGDNPTGPTDTSRPGVVASAIDLAAQSGIDGFVAEYDAAPQTTQRIGLAYAAADARRDFKMALQIDLSILAMKGGGQISGGALDAAFRDVADRASHSSQLQVAGRPVMFVYASSEVEPSDWHAALDRLRAATGLQPFVVADGAALGSPGRYQYGTYGIRDRQSLQTWAADLLNRLRLQPGLLGETAPLSAIPVSPGYDDRRLNRKRSMYIDRANGQRYDDEWSAALESLPDWIVITSWNEYFEQTHIAPGSTTGTRALTQTARWAGQFHTTG